MRSIKRLLLTVFAFAIIMVMPLTVKAAPTDEILDYEITVDITDEAFANITYHIVWKVLDSDSLGPVEWLKIGIPNQHYIETIGLTDNIDYISVERDGGYYADVYFKDKYYEDEVVDFTFSVLTDYMYQLDGQGKATYYFTPGWFDEVDIDNLTVKWNMDKADSWTGGCIMDDGYLVWNTQLDAGDMFSVDVTYPEDAYPFQINTQEDEEEYEETPLDNFFVGIGVIILLVMSFAMFAVPFILMVSVFGFLSGFKVNKEKKVTRTKIEYYKECPNCGGSREEGKENCAYCGSNMVKSKTVIDEKSEDEADKNIIKNYKTDGTFRVGDSDTYVHVNTIFVPHVAHSTSSHSSSSRSSGGSHSCACASSCACACACACAGGGRAGCTTKDFYNTNLKLKFLKK